MESENEKASESIQRHTKAFGPDHIQLISGLVFERLGTRGLWSCTGSAAGSKRARELRQGRVLLWAKRETVVAKAIQNTLFIYASGLGMIYKTALQELYMRSSLLVWLGSFQLCLAWPYDVVASQHSVRLPLKHVKNDSSTVMQ